MAVENLITEHLGIWTSAIKTKSAAGRGSSKKLELVGIKKLSELILELAVRGKLVPQDPNDEPASVLLNRIEAEKAKLVKEGKIKKSKSLPQIAENEKPFELPDGWAIAYIPQVVSYDKYAIKRGPFGSALKKAYFTPSGIKVYEQQHAIGDDFARGEYYISEQKFKELSAFEVKPNDLIISCSGTVGRVAIAPNWMEKGIINQALLKVTLNESVLTNVYFKILFPAFYMQTETLSDLQGTAQKNMVSVDTLKSEPFPLPSISEQHRIVAKVDELMALCDQLEAQTEASIDAHKTLVEVLLATLTDAKDADELNDNWQTISQHFDVLFTTQASIDQLKQTILQLAVMGKLVKQDPNDEPITALVTNDYSKNDETPYLIPENWRWVKLGEISKRVSVGHVGKTSEYYTDEENGIAFLRSQNVRPGKISLIGLTFITPIFHGKLKKSQLKKGDLLVVRVGANRGDSCVIVEEYGELNCANIVFARPKNTAVSNYLNTYFQSPSTQKLLLGTSVGGAQGVINTRSVEATFVALPPLEEQNRIVAKVNELMNLCDSLQARLKQAQTTQLHLTDAIVEQAL
jgi:type I restriction enzyme S subunit